MSTHKITAWQRTAAIADHVASVGLHDVCAHTVAASLYSKHPGMTNLEFRTLENDLQQEISMARYEVLKNASAYVYTSRQINERKS